MSTQTTSAFVRVAVRAQLNLVRVWLGRCQCLAGGGQPRPLPAVHEPNPAPCVQEVYPNSTLDPNPQPA